MTEYYNPEIISKFNKLKQKYEKNNLENTIILEENINNSQMIETMKDFNSLIKAKFNELKSLKTEINKLSTYREKIIEILKDLQSTEQKYISLYQENALNTADLKLPNPQFESLYKLLSGDVRGEIKKENKFDISLFKLECFTMKPDYTHALCDICEKIDDKILEVSEKMNAITEYINIFKLTFNSLEIDKKMFNKYNCTICYDDEVKVCFMPCGHTFCKKCSEKANRKCFACSAAITDIKTIFLLGNDVLDDDEINSPTGEDPVAYVPDDLGDRQNMANYTR